ncbi:unnamed protein product [Rhizophagus irregularis]|nr:unnamed protein product [Rhizophagus irregularis]
MDTSLPEEPIPEENNDDDDTELTKSQVIEQELTKELLSGIITAPSISFETTEQIPSVTHPSSSLDTTQNLVHLFQNAIQAGHKVILSWLYSNSFENKVDEIRHGTGASDKTARSQLYQEMLKHLPATTLGNLRMRTLRAKKIRMLFGEGGVGVDKIKQVTFSVYEISSLTINQIQSVIKNVTSAGRTPEVPNRNQVTSALHMVTDQINSPLISAEVGVPTAPIPITHVSNSSGPVNADDGNPNSINDDSDSSDSEEEMSDDSDDDGYNDYGGYNEYGERDRGYYYRDGRYERKSSPMMSPIISPVTA